MAKLWKTPCWLGLAGLAWCLAHQPAQAFGERILPPGVTIDAGFNAWFKVYTPYKVSMKNLAPWYTYFPADPSLRGPPAASPYPNWPTPFPPAPTPIPNMAPRANPGSGGPPPNPQAAPAPPIASMGSPLVQPVSYYGNAVPSYWYGR